MEMVHTKVGNVRTETFDVDDIISYLPRPKPFLTIEETHRFIDQVGDDIILAKNKALKESGVN